jgi:hypothetical protein
MIERNSSLHWFLTYSDVYQIPPLYLLEGLNYTDKFSMVGLKLGGSLAISRYAFQEVGGYDPELFCGWSPEDWFILDKLNVLYGKSQRVNNSLLHVSHDFSELKRRYVLISIEVRRAFLELRTEEAIKFLSIKKNLLGFNNCVVKGIPEKNIFWDYLVSFQREL